MWIGQGGINVQFYQCQVKCVTLKLVCAYSTLDLNGVLDKSFGYRLRVCACLTRSTGIFPGRRNYPDTGTAESVVQAAMG